MVVGAPLQLHLAPPPRGAHSAEPMFTNLHTHTEYSLLDGLSRIPQLMERAKSLGQEALAITDHGAMYGVIEFYKEAEKRGIKPIIGVEAYVAPGNRQSRDPREKSAYYHLGLLARNEQGFKNLMALTTLANLEGYYYKPRMDKEILAKYGKGLIALTGCPSGELFKALQDGRDADAKAVAGFYRDVFDDVLVEIQDHTDAKGELRGMLDLVNPRLIEFAKTTGLPLVGTNDSHYTYPEDAQIHEILLCIGTNATINDPKRFRLEGDSYYLMGEEEMRRIPLFQEHPEAIDNTQRVVDACDLKLDFGRVQLPDPELPPGMSPQEYLTQVCYEGLKRRYGAEAAGQWPVIPNPNAPTPGAPNEVRERLEYELHVVEVTGFAAYILIVAEIARAAESLGIPMGVRGSAAASILLYTLGVTEIDPIATRLVFERFLNVERREMPDVDMDFADDRREEMIRWAAQRYGHDRVAQIITFGTMGAKAAIRDVGRALGMTFAETDRVARLVPTALHMTIDRALAENVEFKQTYDADAQVRRLVDSAKKLEGVARHAGTHAAGVLISREPLIDVVPLQKAARGDDNALPVTQFEMNTVGEVGLLKMDFLGLSNLTILGKAVDLIKQTKGITLDLKSLPDGDAKTYELLGKGETFAVFQLESPPMRRAIRDLKPASIAELSAMVALYRPGPMQHIPRFCDSKHGRVQVTYPHPALANILDETYGVIVYQDQVLFILRQFAGYTMGEADKVRKAMGKKIAEMMAEQRVKFVKGAKHEGYTEEEANAVFDLIEPFAGYAFNKAHSVCYGTIAYQTAYLKANYAAEYMTAVLALADSHPAGFAERVGAAVAECAKLGIGVLRPDVNHSEVSFSIEEGPGAGGQGPEGGPGSPPLLDLRPPTPNPSQAIRFGLATVKNVGEGAVEGIVAARKEGGRFTSLEDFCRRATLKNFNKRMLESLIKAGALDSFGYNRTTLVANLDRVASLITREQRLKDTGQATMFDLFGDEVPVPLPALELDMLPDAQGETLAWEKELLGVYVSDHPFKRAHPALAGRITAVISEITPEMAGREVTIAGMVNTVRTLLTKAGKTFAAATVEDLSGSIEVTCWPDTYERTREYWQQGKILLLTVRIKQRDERLDVTINDAGIWDEVSGSVKGGLSAPPPPPLALPASGAVNGTRPGVETGWSDAWSDGDTGPSDADLAELEALAPSGPAFTAPDLNPQPPPLRGEGEPVGASANSHAGPNGAGASAAPDSQAAPPKKRNPYARPEPTPIPTEDRARRLLRIAIRETEDEANDRRRLNELVQVLRTLPGPDEVRLTLKTNHDDITLSLGTALVTDGIDQRLNPILTGWGEMSIEPLRAG
jgi:DNA polymerase III subunit alpha